VREVVGQRLPAIVDEEVEEVEEVGEVEEVEFCNSDFADKCNKHPNQNLLQFS